jgi:radical SAM protein with 4Fe4S-binding SPASM domain
MSYIPISLHDNKGYYGCTISTHLAVRLGDLAICPCHRTAYNKYLYGKFTQNEKGEITGIQANNPQMAINILMLNNRYAILGCDSCIFNKICLGTCKG